MALQPGHTRTPDLSLHDPCHALAGGDAQARAQETGPDPAAARAAPSAVPQPAGLRKPGPDLLPRLGHRLGNHCC